MLQSSVKKLCAALIHHRIGKLTAELAWIMEHDPAGAEVVWADPTTNTEQVLAWCDAMIARTVRLPLPHMDWVQLVVAHCRPSQWLLIEAGEPALRDEDIFYRWSGLRTAWWVEGRDLLEHTLRPQYGFYLSFTSLGRVASVRREKRRWHW